MLRGERGDGRARRWKLMMYPSSWLVEAWDMDTRISAGHEDRTVCSKKEFSKTVEEGVQIFVCSQQLWWMFYIFHLEILLAATKIS